MLFEAEMRRWLVIPLLVIGIFLFVGSAVGDVIVVHHHLSNLNLDEHYSSLIIVGLIGGLTLLSRWRTSGIPIFSDRVKLIPDAFTRHFCGWDSSSYIEKLQVKQLT